MLFWAPTSSCWLSCASLAKYGGGASWRVRAKTLLVWCWMSSCCLSSTPPVEYGGGAFWTQPSFVWPWMPSLASGCWPSSATLGEYGGGASSAVRKYKHHFGTDISNTGVVLKIKCLTMLRNVLCFFSRLKHYSFLIYKFTRTIKHEEKSLTWYREWPTTSTEINEQLYTDPWHFNELQRMLSLYRSFLKKYYQRGSKRVIQSEII